MLAWCFGSFGLVVVCIGVVVRAVVGTGVAVDTAVEVVGTAGLVEVGTEVVAGTVAGAVGILELGLVSYTGAMVGTLELVPLEGQLVLLGGYRLLQLGTRSCQRCKKQFFFDHLGPRRSKNHV